MVDFVAENAPNPMFQMGSQAKSALGIAPSPVDLGTYGQNSPALMAKKNAEVDQQIAAKEAERTAATKPLQEGAQQGREELTKALEAGPKQKELPEQVKFTPTDVQQNMGVLMALAALSGAVSRQPLTASLNAMAGMIQGVREGDEARFQKSFKEYDQNLRTVIEKNRQYENEFNRIIKARETSISEKTEQLRLLNLQYDRQVAQVASQKQDYKGVVDLGMKVQKLTSDAENRLAQINAKAQASQQASDDRRYAADLAHQDRQAGIAARGTNSREPKTEAGKNLWAQMVANGTAPAGGRYMNGEVFDRMAAAGVTARDISTGRSGLKSDQASLTKATQKSDALHATLNSFHNNIATWESIAEGQAPTLGDERIKALGNKLQKLDFSDITVLNDVMLKIKTLDSDPAAAAYVTAAMTVAMDYARIMASQGQSAGQIAEGARNEAISLIKAGYNKDARQAMIGVLESDTEGQLKGVEDQQAEIYERISRRAGMAAGKKSTESDRPAGVPDTAKKAPDGKWYSPDPARPGKYILHE